MERLMAVQEHEAVPEPRGELSEEGEPQNSVFVSPSGFWFLERLP